MRAAKLPENESERLKTLGEYDILDTVAEQEFDDLTTIASAICGTSISLVSLVDRDRQWFKSKVGLDADETHRDIAFCAHAILQEGVFIVEDATKDERFFDNPLVTQKPDIRFYAGAPLRAHNGMALGTLCVIDQRPMTLSQEQREALEALARQVEALFELRRQNANVTRAQQEIARKNEELEISNKHKTRFMNHVSHEIRTPLNAILGFSEILAQRMPFTEQCAEDSTEMLIQYINTAALGLSDIVNHVLDISRIESGKMQLNLTDVYIKDVLDEVNLINQRRAQTKDILLSYTLADDVPDIVQVDKVKLLQILVNLVGNAIKFTTADKQVLVEVHRQHEQLIFNVIDEGIGISEEQQQIIFEPFQQLDNELTKQYVGSGLGLTICKELTEFLGGKITCQSVINVGTTFTVEIPYSVGDVSKAHHDENNLQLDLTGKELLIIEDNPVNQLIVKTYLKDSGASIEIKADGTSALEYLQSRKADLILLDLGLPDMTGFDVLAKLNAIGQTNSEVIVISGDVTEASILQAEKLGVRHFLKKPVRKNELMVAIQNTLNLV